MVQRDTKARFLLYANQMAGRLEHVPPGISGLEHGKKSARYGYQLPVAQHKTVDAQISYTPVRKVLAQKKVLWPLLGGNRSTRTILCQTCAVLGRVTDFRLTHRKYARVIKAQSSRIK